MLRVGLIGSGMIAQAHAAAYANIDDAEIVAVASPSEVNDFVADHAPDAATFANAVKLLEEVDPDIVDVCVPTFVHSEIIKIAVSRGYDTLCEKPIASTLQEAKEIKDLVAEHNVSFMVGHTVRFSPPHQKAKSRVEANDVGEPAVIRTSRVGPFPDWSWKNWFADIDKSGGILLDLIVHDFDFLRWTFGDVKRVFTRDVRWCDDNDLMEHAVVILRFEDGAVAHVEGSWAQPDSRGLSVSLEIAGDDGLIEYDNRITPYYKYTQESKKTMVPSGPPAMQREIKAFLESIETGSQPPVSIRDAIEAVRLSFAAIRSAERGKPIRVADIEGLS